MVSGNSFCKLIIAHSIGNRLHGIDMLCPFMPIKVPLMNCVYSNIPSFPCGSGFARSPILDTIGLVLINRLAKQEARKARVDEALCLNEKGLLAKTSMSNIFLVNGSILLTPKEENGILPGITPETVLELASQLNISAFGQDIRLEEVFQAQEAFLMNSLMEIMPLAEVNDKPVGSSRPGPVTLRLMKAYRKLVLTSRTNEQ